MQHEHHQHHSNKNSKEEIHETTGHIDEKTMHGHNKAEHGSEHQNHHGHDHSGMIDDFRRRFWISLLLSVPVIVLSPMVQHILGYSLQIPYSDIIAAILSTIIFFYGGWPFLKGLFEELKQKSPGMMTLIALAISVAYVYSVAVVFGLEGMDFFWELATLIVIMLLGHWLEMKSVQGASRALELLVKMMPSEAHVIENGIEKTVKLEALEKNNIVIIRPGEKIPADGIIIKGYSHIDESMLTGESVPAKKVVDDKVIGGSVNGNGVLQVKVTGTGKESYLNKVISLVEDAQKSKSQTQKLADKAAAILTYVALGVGITTLIVWLSLGFPFEFALERMVTVMVISCPHALGLAIPLVVAISTSVSAKNGLLIRNRTAFENSRKITTVIFDKTGTLTKGSHEVARIISLKDGWNENELLRISAALEQHSEHYISQGIMRLAKERNIEIPESTNFNYLPGMGIEGEADRKSAKVVGPNYLNENNIGIPSNFSEEAETAVYILVENEMVGAITLADQLREESFEAIQKLKEKGIKNLLLTGDNERVAEAVSKKLQMDGFMANVLPHQKLEKVKELQQKGEFVAMTGDGVNDAPALAQADVGIAVGSGTDVAAETADIILVNSNPQDVANLILFGRATYKKMIQNLIWATAYNAITIPLAAGVLYSTGFVLSPAVGAALMSLSTIVVAINAQLLKHNIKSIK